jgi:hypothetical protein
MQERKRSLNPALVGTCLVGILAAAAPAGAVYAGSLKKNTTAKMEFTNQSTDKLLVTVLSINRRDDISQAVPYTIPAAGDGGIVTIPLNVGERIERVILLVDPPAGGHCVLRIDAGPAINLEGDARVTFDTEP